MHRAFAPVAAFIVLAANLQSVAFAQPAAPAATKKAVTKPPAGPLAKPVATAPVAKPTPQQRAQQILETPVNCDFANKPLGECLEALCSNVKVTLKIERTALETDGVDINEQVSLKLSGIKFRTALTLLLNDLYCDWTMNNDTLQVTTTTALKQEVRSHAVADLEAAGLVGDEFLEAIESSVLPESWKAVGGESSLRLDDDRLIVTQTRPGHEGVERLLAQLREGIARAAKGLPTKEARAAEPQSPLRKALKASVTRVLEDVPLATAVEQLLGGQNYIFRRRTLEQAGIETAATVSGNFTEVPADSVLSHLLEQVKLVWFVDDDVLYITTDGDSTLFKQTRVFPIKNLSPGEKPTEDLVKKLHTLVEPNSWAEVGGYGSAVALPGLLVVAHSPQVQRSVEEFFARQPPLKK